VAQLVQGSTLAVQIVLTGLLEKVFGAWVVQAPPPECVTVN
jgi:hypothetical protein